MNQELPDVQAVFRKGRGTRDQIANICWIMEKARECQKNAVDEGAWQATVHGVARVGHDLANKPPPCGSQQAVENV